MPPGICIISGTKTNSGASKLLSGALLQPAITVIRIAAANTAVNVRFIVFFNVFLLKVKVDIKHIYSVTHMVRRMFHTRSLVILENDYKEFQTVSLRFY